ncbi:MAG: hypothetical protein RBT11_18955 [Desulfobacterales bacterium]|jgi:hypothetical protein|nr:hypothetical protein [Desulfobacterales bacterium]
MRDEVIDVLDAAAKRYPIKRLAGDLNKAESSLRNELTQQNGYKLGLWDAVLIMQKTGDLTALNMLEEYFHRIAFPIPSPNDHSPHPLMRLMADMSKEFGETIGALSDAWRDGVISKAEIKRCLKENQDLIKKCIEVEANLKNYLGER